MIEKYKALVRSKFINSPARYMHILGVYKDAVELAKIYNVNLEEVKAAALFHDYLKEESLTFQKRYINIIDQIRFRHFKQNYHAYAAAKYIKKHYNITNKNILSAVKYHVALRNKLTPLNKIIFIADYTEESRPMEDKREIFEIAKTDLDKACYLVLKSTFEYLEILGYKAYYMQRKTYKRLKERVYGKLEHNN